MRVAMPLAYMRCLRSQAFKEITSEDLGFRLGPINAAGRLAKATSVIELFDERDPGRARAKAQELDSLNSKRQQIQRKLVSTVLETLSEEPPPFVVQWGPEQGALAPWGRGHRRRQGPRPDQ